jgi:Lrp/AsnC family leucine-responsive transcriptional regulator
MRPIDAMIFMTMDLDDLDRAILRELQTDGRVSNVELGRRVNLSPPAIHARVRRLEEHGFICRYVTLVDREKLGFDLLCLVNVGLRLHDLEQVEGFRTIIQGMPEVLECYHITGEFDYVLKVVVRNRQELERFLVDKLTPVPGVGRIYTSLALAEVKATTALPIAQLEPVKKSA